MLRVTGPCAITGPSSRRPAQPAGAIPSSRILPRFLRILAAAGLVLALPASGVRASPIVREVRVPVEEGDPAKARSTALTQALTGAVEIFLRVHVPATELQERAKEVRNAFLARPSRHVLRYSLLSETIEGADLQAAVAVELNRDGLFNELRGRGFSVQTLAIAPRILVVSFGSTEGIAAAESVRQILEAEGFRARALPGDPARADDEQTVSAWARSLGCHIAVGVTAEATEDVPAPVSTTAPEQTIEGGARVRVLARGWALDSLRGQSLGNAEAEADRELPDAIEARIRAAASAGRELAYSLLAPLEQSAWSLPGPVQPMAVQVNGLPNAGLVEQIDFELAGLAEAREVRLWEVGYRSAVWRAEMAETGLRWDAVFGAIRLREGRIAWRALEPAAGGEKLETLVAGWVEK
jgi:hypothetical protein